MVSKWRCHSHLTEVSVSLLCTLIQERNGVVQLCPSVVPDTILGIRGVLA